jgi:transmembrane sensor
MRNEDVMTAATEWVVIMQTSEQAENKRREFEAWLEQDLRHRNAYEHAKRDWSGFDKAVTLLKKGRTFTAEALSAEIDRIASLSRQREKLRAQTLRWSLGSVATLAACALVFVLVRWVITTHATATWSPYEGGNGLPRARILSDGSTLYLKGTSTLVSVRMTQEARQIELDRGEILVRVKHGDLRPLLVQAGETEVRATGTAFSVRRDSSGVVDVIVQEGNVVVDPTRFSDPRERSKRIRSVGAYESASVAAGHVDVTAHDALEIEGSLAWTSGRLYLHGTLSQAVQQFNECNERQIIIADPSIENINVMGVYDSQELEDFAASLRPHGIHYKVDSEKDLVLLRAER